jgi:putative oxidoreductase
MTQQQDIGLLILRVLPALGLFLAHGWSKLTHMPGIFENFANPIGLGPALSAALVIFSEVVCALLVLLGLFTRWAAVPIVMFFLIAGLIHHAPDPFPRQEFALIYAVPFLVLIFTGGGRYALDAVIARRKRHPS